MPTFGLKKFPEAGFTLVELLVVISIISVLASIIFATLKSVRVKVRDARRIEDLRRIRLAVDYFFDQNNYYPQSDCGWDCVGYRVSTGAGWNALAAELSPYLSVLPKDPLNTSACPGPWEAGCHIYSYGNAGKNTQRVQYDLTAQLEDVSHSQRCAIKKWKFRFDNLDWCGSYSGQTYEASTE